MLSVQAPVDDLRKIIERKEYVSEVLNLNILKFFGVFVLKNAIKSDVIKHYRDEYYAGLSAKELQKENFHVTSVNISENSALRNIMKEKDFLNVASKFFEGRVGSDFIRIIRKDSNNKDYLFLHQDTGYQIGGMNKYSFFIPLTPCNYNNGGIVLFPGTHNFGYLGDVGEINRFLPDNYPALKSDVEPGDILIMHSATWHESPENISLEDRVYLEVHIQDIDDPTTLINLCGERKSPWKMCVPREELFVNSRTQRLKKLYQEIDELKASQKQ